MAAPAGGSSPKKWEMGDFQAHFDSAKSTDHEFESITVKSSEQVEYSPGIKGVRILVEVKLTGVGGATGKTRTLEVYSGNKEVVEFLLGHVPDQEAAINFLNGCIPILKQLTTNQSIMSVSHNSETGELTIDNHTYHCDKIGLQQINSLLKPPGWTNGTDPIEDHPEHKKLSQDIKDLKDEVADLTRQVEESKGGWFTRTSTTEALEKKRDEVAVRLASKEIELKNFEPRFNMMATAQQLAEATKGGFFDYEKAASVTTPDNIKRIQNFGTEAEVKEAAQNLNADTLLTDPKAFAALNAIQMEGVQWNNADPTNLAKVNIHEMMKESGIDKPQDDAQKEKVREFGEKMTIFLMTLAADEVAKLFAADLPLEFAHALFSHLDYSKLSIATIQELAALKNFRPEKMHINQINLPSTTSDLTSEEITAFKDLLTSLENQWSPKESFFDAMKWIEKTIDLTQMSNAHRAAILLDDHPPELTKSQYSMLMKGLKLSDEEFKNAIGKVDIDKLNASQKRAINIWLGALDNLTDPTTIDMLIEMKDPNINRSLLGKISDGRYTQAVEKMISENSLGDLTDLHIAPKKIDRVITLDAKKILNSNQLNWLANNFPPEKIKITNFDPQGLVPQKLSANMIQLLVEVCYNDSGNFSQLAKLKCDDASHLAFNRAMLNKLSADTDPTLYNSYVNEIIQSGRIDDLIRINVKHKLITELSVFRENVKNAAQLQYLIDTFGSKVTLQGDPTTWDSLVKKLKPNTSENMKAFAASRDPIALRPLRPATPVFSVDDVNNWNKATLLANLQPGTLISLSDEAHEAIAAKITEHLTTEDLPILTNLLIAGVTPEIIDRAIISILNKDPNISIYTTCVQALLDSKQKVAYLKQLGINFEYVKPIRITPSNDLQSIMQNLIYENLEVDFNHALWDTAFKQLTFPLDPNQISFLLKLPGERLIELLPAIESNQRDLVTQVLNQLTPHRLANITWTDKLIAAVAKLSSNAKTEFDKIRSII